jgi:hypothetical protein
MVAPRKTEAPRELDQLIEQYGRPQFPKPRYSVVECLILLGVTRRTFYQRVRDGRYRITKDGKRSFQTHAQLLEAAEGDNRRAS